MQKTIFKDKYPIWTLELKKSEIKQKNVAEIIDYFHKKINNHPFAKYIATFDHYNHIKSIDGTIVPEVLDMQNIIFCYGPDILDTKVAAIRPRSIGVCQLKDGYTIEFMEAPSKPAHDAIVEWIEDIKNYS